jgi:signal transduction histidine kinase/DNA-binding response OmpR family regulator
VPLNSGFDNLGDDDGERAAILVVDDLPDKLLVFRTLLEDLGHELVFARSGGEALKAILQQEFAVILLDVNMPDIDGFETASLIRRYKRSAHTPIIFVTSYADEMQTMLGYSLGAVDYIQSPVIPEVLRSKITVFVDLHLMQQRLRRRADERVALAAAEAARSAAEESTRRSSFLGEASRVLSGSLDAEIAARRLLEMLVPGFVPRALLALADAQGGIEQVLDASAVGEDAAAVVRREIGVLDPDEGQSLRQTLALGPGTPGGSSHVFPLVTAGRAVAALLVDAGAARVDWATVAELVDRAAVALDNARLYRNLQLEIEERRVVEAELQASSRRKDEFLAMLSHELRNPLAPIRNALEVIRRLVPDAEPRLTWATEVAARQVRHMSRLIEDLLDVARISQGKITLQKEALDLRQVLTHGIETVRPFIESRRHRFSSTLPDVPVLMRGDFARLSQVAANLLNNAAKYTEEGGSIELSLAMPSEGEAVIIVRDDGIGIEPELLPHIFELFEQGKRTLDREQGGLGVGLTLVHRLVGMHHGSIEVHSDGPGRGSQFTVRVPCLCEAVGVETEAAAAPPRDPAACRVLVVDDNHDAAEAVAVLLGMSGHQVQVAGDAMAALAAVPDFAPEVVVLDIGLPGIDGYELARRLRALPQTRAALLIALTGYGQLGDRGRTREAGCDQHLTKPTDPDELQRLIEEWRSARAGAVESSNP